MRLTIDGLRNHDFREPPRKPPVIGCAPQRPIQSGRRNLERVALGDRLFDVQDRADIAADALAVLDRRRCIGPSPPLRFVGHSRVRVAEGHVDEDAQHPAARLATELNVEDLQIV